MIGVYKIMCTANGKRYIGSSVNVSKRISNHITKLRHCDHRNRHLQRAWDKHGESAFRFEMLLECDLDAVLVWEKRIIDNVRPEFNCRGIDIEMGLLHHSAESRARMSVAARNMSPDHRAHMSAAQKGHRTSDEARARMSVSQTGRKASPETKLKLHLAQMGNKKWLGRHHTEETKAKQAEAARGHIVSAATRAKISETKKRNNANAELG